MRVLVVNDLLQGGGVEKLMYDLVMRFHNEHEITILTDKRDTDFELLYPSNVGYLYQMEEDYPKGRNRIERKLIARKRYRTEEKLKQTISDMKFDVMLCMKESWIMMMAMTYGSEIPKRIAWVHTDYEASYYTAVWYQTREAEVAFMQKFNYVVCVSQKILDSIKMIIGDPGNLILCYNPLDMNEIIKKSLEPVQDITRSERPLFVTVGRLNYQKGYDILMEVCNLLNQEGYQYDVWIVGGGEACDQYRIQRDLERLVYKYQLDNVHLLGFRNNPYKYIRQGDWFLSSSRYEGFSFVSQEAAMIGKPLVLTECAGVMELLKTRDNGIVMENSFAGIYKGMKEALEKPQMGPEYVKRMGVKEPKYYGEDRMKAIEKLFIA